MNELDMMNYGPEREKNRKAKESLEHENAVDQEAVVLNEDEAEVLPTPEPETKKKDRISKLKEKIGKVFEGKSEEEKDADFEKKQQKETDKKNAELNKKFAQSFPEFFPKHIENKTIEIEVKVGRTIEIPHNHEVTDFSKLEGLTWEQKTVLLERMQGYAVQEAKLRARDMFELDKQEANNGTGFWGKVKSVGKNIGLQFSKNAKLLAYEKNALAHIKQDDLDFDFFKQTVAERDIWVNKKGEACFDYFSETGITYPPIPDDKEDVFYDAKHQLDKSAYEFKNIPENWATPEASKELQQKYLQAKNAFEQAKEKQFEQLVSVGVSEQEAGSKLAELEGRVMTDRLFASNPRIHKAFTGIEKGKIWKKYLTGYVQDNGYYMAGGGALRKGAIGAGALAGFGAATIVAAPLISGAIGYLRGKKRTTDSLAYEAGNRRRVGTDTPSRSFEVEDDLGQSISISRDELLYKKGEHASTESLQKIGHTIARMRQKIETASNEGDVAFWRIQLENRLDYVREKIEQGEMVFDKGQSGLQEKMSLNTLLREGATTLAVSDSELQQSFKEELAEKIAAEEEHGGAIATNDIFGSAHRFQNRIASLGDDRDAYREALAKEEKKYVKEKALESAKFGALGGLIGAGVSHWLWGQGTSDGQVTEETLKIKTPVIDKTIVVPDSATHATNPIDSTLIKNPAQTDVDTVKQVIEEIPKTKTPEVDLSDTIVAKGDGVSSVIIRQIEDNKDLALKLGWKEGEDLHTFAFNKGVELIKQEGYMNGLKEVRLTEDAIGHASYKVEFDTDGKAMIHEYFDGKKVIGEENINKPYEELFEKKVSTPRTEIEHTESIPRFYPPAISENEIDMHGSDLSDGDTTVADTATYTGPKIPRPDEATDPTIIKTVDYTQLGAIEPQFQKSINDIFDSKFFGFKIEDGIQSKKWMNVAYKDTGVFLSQKTSDRKLQELAQLITGLQKSSGINPAGYKIIDYIHLAMANKK